MPQASRPLALVRRPGPRLAEGLVTHIERAEIDVDLAERQWSGYVEALGDCGWETAEVEPADDCPDAVFVEDAAVVFGEIAVVTRPGAVSRRPETSAVAAALADTGLELHTIDDPATLDGGDVLKIGRTAYVGVGGRTNLHGVWQLEQLLAPRGWSVLAVPVTRVLHLKSAVTALPDGTVIGFPPLVDDLDVFERFRAVPEPEGAHVVLLGDDRLLMSDAAPASAELFESLGYRPIPVGVSEFEKLEGCVTCLSIRIR